MLFYCRLQQKFGASREFAKGERALSITARLLSDEATDL